MKKLQILLWLRALGIPALLTAAFYLSQKIAFVQTFLFQEPVLWIDSFNRALSCCMLIIFGNMACEKPVSDVWNRLTPLQDKPTYIENDLVYFLSAALGFSIFCVVFLGVSFVHSPYLFGGVLLASVACLPIRYSLTRWIENVALPIPQEELPEDETSNEVAPPPHKEANFWRRRFSFLIAAVAFQILVALAIWAIMAVKSGLVSFQSIIGEDGFWECTIVTMILMSIFGSAVTKIGQSTLSRMNVAFESLRKQNALAYFLGFSIVTFVVVSITIGCMWGAGAKIGTLGAYSLAYIIISACFALAAIVFSWTYGKGHDSYA